jgi:hypothetical protein
MVRGVGLDCIVGRHYRRSELLFKKSWLPLVAAPVFSGTIFLLLMLHVPTGHDGGRGHPALFGAAGSIWSIPFVPANAENEPW